MKLPGFYKLFQERWEKFSTVWIYSDPHFSDSDLAAGLTNRPSDQEQIDRINKRVGRKDAIIFLGDIGNIECIKQIRGYKILIMGNHDKGVSNYEEAFDEIYEGALLVGEKLLLSHEPVDIPWVYNIHGHVHSHPSRDETHFNCCSDVIRYAPIHLGRLLAECGFSAKVSSIHRLTIDKAIQRKRGKL